MIVDQNSDNEFAKNFESANDMLWTQWNQIEEFSLEFLDDEDNDEDDFDDAVYDAYHESVESSLKKVLRRLDKESVFEMTNKRENIHLGVLQGSWSYDEMLLGPFQDLNPPVSCQRYEQEEVVFQRVLAALRR